MADIYDALTRTINGNPKGLSIKEIACRIWPTRTADTARSVLSRAINPEYADMNLDPEEMVKAMEASQNPEPIIHFLCDYFGYEYPVKKTTASFESEIQAQIENLSGQLRGLMRDVQHLGRLKTAA